MNFNSKKTSLIILGITSLICSRATFLFIDDPEGPNLLIVFGLALFIYLPAFAAYTATSSSTKKLAVAIVVQLLVVTGLYFWLN